MPTESFVDKIATGFPQKDKLYEFAKSYGIEEVDGVISSAFPSVIYVKVGDAKADEVPSTAYDHKTKFENGMKVRVTRKGKQILKVVPIL